VRNLKKVVETPSFLTKREAMGIPSGEPYCGGRDNYRRILSTFAGKE
jgi:hypothetical protein